MGHDSDPSTEQTDDSDQEYEGKPLGCGTIIFRFIIAGVVIFLAAFAFLFGVCLLA